MARYKHIDTSPRFLAVDLQRQLLPGTFEHALSRTSPPLPDSSPGLPTTSLASSPKCCIYVIAKG